MRLIEGVLAVITVAVLAFMLGALAGIAVYGFEWVRGW